MDYYLPQSFVVGYATIRRERSLPPGAIGEVMVREGAHVEGPEVVLRGAISGQYMILDALESLGLRKAEDITPEMFEARVGEAVEVGGVIAQNRRRKMLSPDTGVIVRIEGSQVILQSNPTPIEVRALCPGEVQSVRGTTSVLIVSTGALLQCGWGNGKQAFTSYQAEPSDGIESLPADGIFPQYTAVGMLLTKPILTPRVFDIAAGQGMSAIIAPSMHSNLRELAIQQKIPVILTEGFGEQKMSEMVYNLLSGSMGRQVTIDATEPGRWTAVRPEIIVPLPMGAIKPPSPEIDQPLGEGMLVRVTRAPAAGASGRIKRIVETPRTVDSGLRLPGAEVQLSNGRVIFVPLANLELTGQSADAQSGA
jgi:hypothetical protein